MCIWYLYIYICILEISISELCTGMISVCGMHLITIMTLDLPVSFENDIMIVLDAVTTHI